MIGIRLCRALSAVLGSVGLVLIVGTVIFGAPAFAFADGGGGGYAGKCSGCTLTGNCANPPMGQCPSGDYCEGTTNCEATCSCKQRNSNSCACA